MEIEFRENWPVNFGIGLALAFGFFIASAFFPSFSFVELFQNLVYPNLFTIIPDTSVRIFLVVFVAPPVEEVIFRGVLPLQLMDQGLDYGYAQVISAASFMGFHLLAYGLLNTGALFAAFLFGLFSEFIFRVTGDIATSIGLHMGVNAIVSGLKFVSIGGLA